MLRHDHEEAVVASAVWAAAGDALGWMTELADVGGLRARTGRSRVDVPIQWRRRIGGRAGVTVLLPAGSYSDDTQLRLAVSRATRGDGQFDVEAFAKIELPIWQSYALGAGRSTMLAANNLARSDVSWFSNFYEKPRRYLDAGGNGAAMRVQPHVWKSPTSEELMLRDVVRDAVTTHGHVNGIGGAVFHALCLRHALVEKEVPGPLAWKEIARRLYTIANIVSEDPKLGLFWLGAWEHAAHVPFSVAVQLECGHFFDSIEAVISVQTLSPEAAYVECLQRLHGFDEATRGSGLATALAAAALAHLFKDAPPADALVVAANALSSDTDSIATMAGALLGAARPSTCEWTIQDAGYIVDEGKRLAAIARGEKAPSFAYPDLLSWRPPVTQSDGVGMRGSKLALAGLGLLEPIGPSAQSGEFEWRLARLPFGQSVWAKYRSKIAVLHDSQMPFSHTSKDDTSLQRAGVNRPNSSFTGSKDSGASARQHDMLQSTTLVLDVDELTQKAIASGFDPIVVGEGLIECCSGPNGSVNLAVGYAAIIAKARLARQRRQRGGNETRNT